MKHFLVSFQITSPLDWSLDLCGSPAEMQIERKDDADYWTYKYINKISNSMSKK